MLHAPFSTFARALSRWGLGRLRNLLQLRASAEQRQMIDQAAAAEGISRTEFIQRSCKERARDVLLDRTLISLTPQQTTAHSPAPVITT
jgi:uncharacterized protein (DUF1778 family)